MAIPRKLIIEEQFFHAKSFSWQIVEWATRPVTTGPSETRGQRTTPIQKSDNLQYNTLDCWFAGTNDSSTKCLMFQVFFFMISWKILCKNGFNVFSIFSYELTKIKTKSFECLKSIRNYEKIMLGTSDAWSPSHLSTQQTSVLYCRLSDLYSAWFDRRI